MSSSGDGSGTVARSAVELQKAMAEMALPAIQEAMTARLSQFGNPNAPPADVARAYGQAREATFADSASSQAGARAALQQSALQAGLRYNPRAMQQATSDLSTDLERARNQRLRALDFSEAQAGQSYTNQTLNALVGGSGQLLSGALNFGQGALQSQQLLQQAQQQQSQQWATYGGILGAVAGTAIGGPAGTALGSGIGGAVGGYFGGR